jgi:3-hydroxybutyrate dehydrogenase
MSKSLAGKTALITGSTSGIGLAYAKALAGEGANVVINGFGDADSIEKERLGLEALSGAKQHVAPVEEFPLDKWDLIIALNLNAAFHTTRLAIPYMKDKKWGRIIQTASAHSLVASPFKSAYVTAKHGLNGFTKTVALEVATFGITANCISPGYVWTPLVENQIPDTMKARNMTREQVMNDVLLAGQPTKQFVTAEQVAATALYLCSDAAAQITGANLSIDGGWTAQ